MDTVEICGSGGNNILLINYISYLDIHFALMNNIDEPLTSSITGGTVNAFFCASFHGKGIILHLIS